MRITYRRCKIDDAEKVQQILHNTWLETYSDFIPSDDIVKYLNDHYHTGDLEDLARDPNMVGFIAEADGSVVGYERTFYNQEEQRLYVQQLYILPQFQGLGIGKQLMVFAAEHARTFNFDRVWLSVMIENTSALLWYQKMGYQIVEKMPYTMGKTVVDHYIGYVPLDRVLSS